MTKEAEHIEVITDPPGDKARDAVQQKYCRHLLQTHDLMVGAVANELKVERAEASMVVLSIVSTTLMLYVRGYPKEHHTMMFGNISQYFERMAVESQTKEGEVNDRPTSPAT